MVRDVLREELLALLEGGNAHMSLDEAVSGLPLSAINSRPPETPYRLWHFVEHIRIAQWDILEFIRNPQHVSPDYPMGYRPAPDETTDEAGWLRLLESARSDLECLKEMVRDRSVDLLAPLPHAPDYAILREILTVADHNAYHVGELAILRQVMGLWPPDHSYLTGRPD